MVMDMPAAAHGPRSAARPNPNNRRTERTRTEPEVNPESGRALVQRSPALRLRFGVEERNAERTA